MEGQPTVQPPSRAQFLRTFFLGGILPVIAFTVIEEVYGTLAGLVAGMVFGVGEIFYEKIKLGRVDPITWGGNGLILVMGAVSLFTQDGVWFKLQPAILEAVFGAILIGSVLLGKPVLIQIMKKQGQWDQIRSEAKPLLQRALGGLTLRFGIFFWIHAALATWAAIYASTTVWAMLKGIGFTVSSVIYLLAESVLLRYRIRSQ